MSSSVKVKIEIENFDDEVYKLNLLLDKLKEANSLANELASRLDVKVNKLFETDI
ncbi:hypothetical protein PT250_02490 [Erysipelothrix rhusiopathiae]|uniref:hypothetical protein n=1 Tax=Erysipelothrix rhusiopathiae TaxID=1648 RepID=UPI000DFC6261|nr:hypothetical protein [Erysipelothrix rhusiopathiae]MDE8340978.1 hypothetical protein [Erysipelothrix rhusiopathiae]STD01514.1 Uncharacterised protein [Erysipelothrix rhusiopathiae]